MIKHGSISFWIEQLKAGDSRAAQALWERFYFRLVALARKKLGAFPRGVADEEDVVQSAFLSFCQRAEAGQFPDLLDRHGLWALLAVITARKATNQMVRYGSAKRGGAQAAAGRANSSIDGGPSLRDVISQEPTPEFVALLVEQIERVMELLNDPAQRVIVLYKLEGRTNPEIARLLGCSLSGVERKLRLIRHGLEAELLSGTTGGYSQ
jgi:RNA polymerase sigma factor (sigma-70 family)